MSKNFIIEYFGNQAFDNGLFTSLRLANFMESNHSHPLMCASFRLNPLYFNFIFCRCRIWFPVNLRYYVEVNDPDSYRENR